jgi:hypothetical protein
MADYRVNLDNLNSWLPGSRVEHMGIPMTAWSETRDALSRISDRAISIVNSDRTREALVTVANHWSEEHRPDLFKTSEIPVAVRNFRRLLSQASLQHKYWPTVVVAWNLPAKWSALFYRHDTPTPFDMESQHIVLNGLVSNASLSDRAVDTYTKNRANVEQAHRTLSQGLEREEPRIQRPLARDCGGLLSCDRPYVRDIYERDLQEYRWMRDARQLPTTSSSTKRGKRHWLWKVWRYI